MRKTQKSIVIFLIGAFLFTFSAGLAEYRLTPLQAIQLEITKNKLEKPQLIKRFNTKQSSYFLYETEKEYLWFGVSRTGFLWRIDGNHIYSEFSSQFGEISGPMIIKEKNKDKDIIFSYGNNRFVEYNADGFTQDPKAYVIISHADDNTMISLNDSVFEKNTVHQIAPHIFEVKESPKKTTYEDKDGDKHVNSTNRIIFLENSRGVFKVDSSDSLFSDYSFSETPSKMTICKDDRCENQAFTKDYSLLDNVSSSIMFYDQRVEEFKKGTEKIASISLIKTEEAENEFIMEMVKKEGLYYFIVEKEHQIYDDSTNLSKTNKSYSVYRIYDEAVKDVLNFFETILDEQGEHI